VESGAREHREVGSYFCLLACHIMWNCSATFVLIAPSLLQVYGYVKDGPLLVHHSGVRDRRVDSRNDHTVRPLHRKAHQVRNHLCVLSCLAKISNQIGLDIMRVFAQFPSIPSFSPQALFYSNTVRCGVFTQQGYRAPRHQGREHPRFRRGRGETGRLRVLQAARWRVYGIDRREYEGELAFMD